MLGVPLDQLGEGDDIDDVKERLKPLPSLLEKRDKEIKLTREILQLWRSHAIAMIDEVDTVLHPLRSELNFPIGAKEPLAAAKLRWSLPIFLVDVFIMSAETSKKAKQYSPCLGQLGPAEFRDDIREALDTLSSSVDAGVSLRSIAKSSTLGLVILDNEFYDTQIRPPLTEIGLAWVLQQDPFKPLARTAKDWMGLVREYLESGKVEKPELRDLVGGEAMQLINLLRAWVTSYLPHCMSKRVRVNFGLLQLEDLKRLSKLTQIEQVSW